MAKSCPTGKMRYRSRYEARSAILAIWASKTKRVNLRGSYYCADCEGWHVTSARKKGKNYLYTEGGRQRWRSTKSD